MTPKPDAEYERKIIANGREHGCHITCVFDPDSDTPAFAYSVGFPETVGQPEVIIFGLSMDIMQFMINETLRKCREGFRLEDGIEFDGLLEGHVCIPCAIPATNISREYFNSAMWFRQLTTGEEMTEAFQIVWPGAEDGLFPWDEKSSDAVRAMQICLFAEEEGE